MRFEIQAGARARAIQLHGTGPAFTVSVDGRAEQIDAAGCGSRWSLIRGGSRSYEVLIDRGTDGFTVYVEGRRVPVSLAPAGRSAAGRAPGPIAGDGPQRVIAPMPGRVAKVLVKVGDAVSARQGLVVVEAMKMENELRASRAGTVTEVRASEGALVEAHAVLVVVA